MIKHPIIMLWLGWIQLFILIGNVSIDLNQNSLNVEKGLLIILKEFHYFIQNKELRFCGTSLPFVRDYIFYISFLLTWHS